MSEDNELCGECRQAPSADSFMVQCDHCNKWFHGRCCSLTEWQAAEFDMFHCHCCVKQHGPSKRKKRQNWHRHDCFETNAENKPPQCGTVAFLKQLKGKKFADVSNAARFLPDGSSVCREFLEEDAFSRPIIVGRNEGLGMRIPDPESFSLSKAAEYLGDNCRVDIIDSERQLVFESTLGKLRDYFAAPKRDKIYNVISLELTGTPMESLVQPPVVVRELSWLPGVWPNEAVERLVSAECPRTERFMLISAAGSYTDFHVDFGGSSVWYHIVKGSKVFYLAPPTDANLKAYERWNDANDRVDCFLGDELSPCYKLNLYPGQTLLLPGGWVHAVVTPSDSIVFGGNFLHSFDAALQLRIFDLELRIRTDSKFLFPEFHSVNFFAARQLAQQLRKEINNPKGSARFRKILLAGASALHMALRRWMADDKCMKKCVLSPAERISITNDLLRSMRQAEAVVPPSPIKAMLPPSDEASPSKRPKVDEKLQQS